MARQGKKILPGLSGKLRTSSGGKSSLSQGQSAGGGEDGDEKFAETFVGEAEDVGGELADEQVAAVTAVAMAALVAMADYRLLTSPPASLLGTPPAFIHSR